MVPNPCPCWASLVVGVYVVAASEFIVVSFYIPILVSALNDINTILEEAPSYSEEIKPIKYVVIFGLFSSFIHLLFAVLLCGGAWMKNAVCCWTWIGFSLVLGMLLPAIVVIVAARFYGMMTFLILCETVLLFQFYRVYVVYAFIAQLREQRQQQVHPATPYPKLEGSDAARAAPPQSKGGMDSDFWY